MVKFTWSPIGMYLNGFKHLTFLLDFSMDLKTLHFFKADQKTCINYGQSTYHYQMYNHI